MREAGRPPPAAPARRRLALIAFVALSLAFGLELLRTLLPLLVFTLRDRLGWRAEEIGLLALGIFASPFLAPALSRPGGARRLLLGAGLAFVAARLGLQLWHGEVLVDLALAGLALVALGLLAPALVALVQGPGAARALVAGAGAGLLLDGTRLALLGSWDLPWRDGAGSSLAVLLTTIAYALLLLRLGGGSGGPVGRRWQRAWPWLGAGPLLFLQLALFANPGRLAVASGWSPEAAALALVVAQLAGLAAALTVAPELAARRGVVGAAALLLVALLGPPWPAGGWAWAQLAAGQALAALLALRIAAAGLGGRNGDAGGGPGAGACAVAAGGAGLLLGALIFLATAGFDLRLPLDAERLPALAAALLGLAAVAAPAATSAERRWPAAARRRLLGLAATLLLAPAALLFRPAPAASGAPPERLRIVTYNVHCGAGVDGDLDLEAIARTIEAASPEVVALQEASRGWLVNGGVDLVAWLARRLAMPHVVFGGHAGRTWGNAVLSRRPFLAAAVEPLPPADLAIPRGLIDVRLPLDGGVLTLLATHLHAGDGTASGAVRLRQVAALRRRLAGPPAARHTVIAGDLNAAPGAAAIARLRRAGLIDAWSEAGVGDGETYPSPAARERIDYLWITPDLAVSKVRVLPSLASDHLPLTAEIRLRGPAGSREEPALTGNRASYLRTRPRSRQISHRHSPLGMK